MKYSKTYDISTIDGLKKAESAYLRHCNKYNRVEKVYSAPNKLYFILYD